MGEREAVWELIYHCLVKRIKRIKRSRSSKSIVGVTLLYGQQFTISLNFKTDLNTPYSNLKLKIEYAFYSVQSV